MADEKVAVVAIVQKFLRSISLRRPPFNEALEYVLPDGWCALSHPGDFWVGRLGDLVSIIEERLATISDGLSGGFEEQFAEPGPEVWIHEDLAAVWAGYQTYIDNKEMTRGISLFGLHKTADGWKISGVADTEFQEGLGLSPVLQTVSPEVMEPINYFLDRMANGDWDKIPSVLVMDGGITNSRRKDDRLRSSTWTELLGISKTIMDNSTSEIREHLSDVETRICGDFAFVWAPFVIDVNGQTVNKGASIFTLVKRESGWIISGCQDTSMPVD